MYKDKYSKNAKNHIEIMQNIRSHSVSCDISPKYMNMVGISIEKYVLLSKLENYNYLISDKFISDNTYGLYGVKCDYPNLYEYIINCHRNGIYYDKDVAREFINTVQTCWFYDCDRKITSSFDDNLGEITVCDEHMCNFKACHNMQDIFSDYCKKHKCIYCSNAATKKYYNGNLCDDHTCKNCNKYPVNHNSNYCKYCICNAESCMKEKVPNGYFCIDCTCNYENCKKMRTRDYAYCDVHKCKIDKCPNIIKDRGDNTIIKSVDSWIYIERLSNYCTDHSCHVENCYESKIDDNNFCIKHICSSFKCQNSSIDDKNYCIDHVCSVENCGNEMVSPTYKLCNAHLCNICEINKIDTSYNMCSQCMSCDCSYGKFGISKKNIIDDVLYDCCIACCCIICRKIKANWAYPCYFKYAEDEEDLKLANEHKIRICDECIKSTNNDYVRLN